MPQELEAATWCTLRVVVQAGSGSYCRGAMQWQQWQLLAVSVRGAKASGT
jgi:hypothetical protein